MNILETNSVFIIEKFITEQGTEVQNLKIAYSMIGKPNKELTNIIWAVHPLTANQDVRKWLPGLVGPFKTINTEKFCVLCPNIPGSPYGSTGPLDINPKTNKKYYYDFPVFTPRDVVDIFEYLRNHLAIPKIRILLGASMGGQLCFQWLVSYPNAIEHAIIISADAQMSPWAQALHNTLQQNAIRQDSTWGNENDDAGKKGMSLARQIGVISYRSPRIFSLSQSKQQLVKNDADESGKSIFENVQSYLQYQGDKFLTRFNTFSYWFLIEMMNEHDVSKGHASLEMALKKIKASVLLISTDSDLLFTSEELLRTKKLMKNVLFREISSVYGHDAFFIETKQLEDIIQEYFANVGIGG